MTEVRRLADGGAPGCPLGKCRHKTEETSLARDLITAVLNRIDAWGVALIVCIVAFLVHDAIHPSTLLLSAAIAVTYWLGYTVNDYCDAPFDSQDEFKARRNFFVNHPISMGKALAGFLAIGCVPLFSFAHFGLRGVLIFAISVLVMWAYSAPPLRLKSRPGLDLVAHALFVQTFPYFICLVLIDAVWTPLDYVLLAVNFLASLSGQLAQQVRDFDVDSRIDVNFATTVGQEASATGLRVVTSALVTLVVLSLVNGTIPFYLAPIALMFLPIAAQRLRGDGGPASPKAIQLPTMGALLYTGLLLAVSLFRWHSA